MFINTQKRKRERACKTPVRENESFNGGAAPSMLDAGESRHKNSLQEANNLRFPNPESLHIKIHIIHSLLSLLTCTVEIVVPVAQFPMTKIKTT